MMPRLLSDEREDKTPYGDWDKLSFCRSHGARTHRCLKCDVALCLGCKHYEINRRLWCSTCAAPYRPSFWGNIAKDLLKLAAVAVVYVGTVWLAAMTIHRGVFWGGLAAAAVGIELFWPSHRIDVVERGGHV